jgi:hypothetical protein
MKQFGALTLSLLIAAAMTGCVSTSESSSTQGPAYPELKVMSDKTYVWDDSISEALNVARMAHPAGVGGGMQDFADGTKANTGRVGAGEQVFDSAIGLVGMGAYGVLSMGVLNSDVNELLDWNPSFVFLVPVNEITLSGKYDLKKTQQYVGKLLESTLKAKYSDMTWFGAYNAKGDISNTTYAFKTSECKNALSVHYYDEKNNSGFMKNNGMIFSENTNFEEYCGIYVNLSVSGFLQKNGKNHAVVVGEVNFGHYFLDSLTKLDEYILFPDTFKIVTFDSRAGKRLGYKHAFVTKNSIELKFQK